MKHKSLSSAKSPNHSGNSKLRLVLIALLCAGMVVGCAQIRKVTYPRDFVYLEKKQLRSKMALLSFYMRQLDEILLAESTVTIYQQQRILELLNEMKDLTYELGGGVTPSDPDIDDQTEFGGGVMTNHLVIDDHIDQFKSDVNNAIIDASANPPNYFALGRLTGSCIGCHKYRD